MDPTKTGALIKALRSSKSFTQRELAEALSLCPNAVSKWERGAGCPDVSLLPRLAELLGVQTDCLLSGMLSEHDAVCGNIKKLRFYVCPNCGNILTATGEGSVSCCGKPLARLEMQKAAPDDRLRVEYSDNEFFITSPHEMSKEHFISFAALLTGDTLFLRKLYPEWNMQLRIPCTAHGTLVWYCTRHGLFYQLV